MVVEPRKRLLRCAGQGTDRPPGTGGVVAGQVVPQVFQLAPGEEEIRLPRAWITACDRPQKHAGVAASGSQRQTIGGEGELEDAAKMAFIAAAFLPSAQFPQPNGAVHTTRSQHAAVRRECQ